MSSSKRVVTVRLPLSNTTKHVRIPIPSVSPRETIRAILMVDSNPASMDLIFGIMSMEARQLPSELSGHHFKPKESSTKLCCFDTASRLPGWSSHQLCPRCQQLNKVLKALSKNGSSSIAKSIVGTCLIVTDCVSEDQHRGKVVELPTELIDKIVDFVFDEFHSSRDGTLVASLMHTSTIFRYKMTQRFAPITLYECDQPKQTPSHQIRVPRSLHAHIWDTLQDFFLDVTVRRHLDRTKDRHLADTKHGKELITTLAGLNGGYVDCQVTLHLDEARRFGGEIAHHRLSVESEHIDHGHFASINVSDATDALQRALDNLDAVFELQKRSSAIKHPAELAPIFANVHQRALSGSTLAPSAGALVDVKLTIRSLAGDRSKFVSRSWQFDTMQVRQAT